MGFKSSRTISFFLIALIYIGAAAVGIVCYRALPYSQWLNLLVADCAATVFTFVFSLIFINASVYDPYWSVQPMVILLAFAIGRPHSWPHWLLLIVILAWGLRLTANWAYTFHGLDCQDWRYSMLKDNTGVFYPLINLIGIHIVPTLVVYGCVIPAVLVLTSSATGNVITVCCFALSSLAVMMQGYSDYHMQKFRKEKTGGFIRSGLWKYSRHPNYLGEILMWWGVALLAVSVLGFHWYLIAGAVANTLLFFLVSIPMAEARQAKKEGFEAYKNETRMLLPMKR